MLDLTYFLLSNPYAAKAVAEQKVGYHEQTGKGIGLLVIFQIPGRETPFGDRLEDGFGLFFFPLHIMFLRQMSFFSKQEQLKK